MSGNDNESFDRYLGKAEKASLQTTAENSQLGRCRRDVVVRSSLPDTNSSDRKSSVTDSWQPKEIYKQMPKRQNCRLHTWQSSSWSRWWRNGSRFLRHWTSIFRSLRSAFRPNSAKSRCTRQHGTSRQVDRSLRRVPSARSSPQPIAVGNTKQLNHSVHISILINRPPHSLRDILDSFRTECQLFSQRISFNIMWLCVLRFFLFLVLSHLLPVHLFFLLLVLSHLLPVHLFLNKCRCS